jgi:pilus assembly protein CpaB
MSDVVGRTVISSVVTGQTMFEGLVAAPGSAGGIQALIPPGMRAVNVDIGEATGLGNQIAPGCHVDVIATLRDGDQSMARTIVENVKVSAVTRASTGRRDDKAGPVRSVTLIVKPKEANIIELANAQGKTRLIMRGTTDSTSSDSTVSERELRGQPEPEPQPVAAKSQPDDVFENKAPEPASAPAAEPVTPKRAVQIIKGSTESTIYMEQEEGSGAAPPPTTVEQQQPPRQQPKAAKGGKSVAGEEHRKLSGASSDTAPRTDARP